MGDTNTNSVRIRFRRRSVRALCARVRAFAAVMSSFTHFSAAPMSQKLKPTPFGGDTSLPRAPNSKRVHTACSVRSRGVRIRNRRFSCDGRPGAAEPTWMARPRVRARSCVIVWVIMEGAAQRVSVLA